MCYQNGSCCGTLTWYEMGLIHAVKPFPCMCVVRTAFFQLLIEVDRGGASGNWLCIITAVSFALGIVELITLVMGGKPDKCLIAFAVRDACRWPHGVNPFSSWAAHSL